MKERPILFSAPMVRALLDGSKTQTRRIIKNVPVFFGDEEDTADGYAGRYVESLLCPYGQTGDQLWVRETFCPTPEGIAYKATTDTEGERCRRELGMHWKPSILCTRNASRIQLEITGVRVERLNDCSGRDAIAEGTLGHGGDESRALTEYMILWEKINGAGSWAENPWVWVIEFKQIAK